MSHHNVFVGLDYHQDNIQVCVVTRTGKVVVNRSCENSLKAIQRVVRPTRGRNIHVALEACCGAADLADELVDFLDRLPSAAPGDA